MTHKSIIDRISSNSWAWLWSSRVQVELLPLLGPLWKRADAAERRQLVDAVLRGMPRDRFEDDLGQAEWERMNGRAIWERLARIERDGGDLPADAKQRLTEISAQFPDLTLTGDAREDFSSWSETHYGYPSDVKADELSALALAGDHEGLFETLIGGDYNRDGRLRNWEAAVTGAPELALPLIRWMRTTDRWDNEVLAWTLQGLTEAPWSVPLGDWNEVFRAVPPGSWGSALHSASRAVERLVAAASPDDMEGRLTLWDQAFAVALEGGAEMTDGDLLNAAINRPTGRLSEGLLDLSAAVLRAGRKLGPEVLSRLETVIETINETDRWGGAGVAARVPVYARLSMLAAAEPLWAIDHLVPRLDWEDAEEARIAWEGFLWSPQVGPDLWLRIAPYALAACLNYERIGRGRSRLATLLVAKFVEEGPPASADLMVCLRSVDGPARTAAARYASNLLAGAGDKSGDLWRSRVRPLFAEAWPQEVALRSSDLTLELVVAATRAGDAFPDAVAVVSRLMAPVQNAGMILRRIDEAPFVREHPQAVIQLLLAIVPRDARLGGSRLRALLGVLAASGGLIPGLLREAAGRR